MSHILCWNCRGLGSPEAIRSLRNLIRQNSPNIIFLCETKRWGVEMEKVRRKLSLDHGVWVDAIGRAGGWPFFGRTKLMFALGRWTRDILTSR